MSKKLNGEYSKRVERSYRVAYLICAFISYSITEGERLELLEWINADKKNARLFEELTGEAYTRIKVLPCQN